MSFPLLSAGDVLVATATTTVANHTTSILSSRMGSFARESLLNRVPSYCRSPTGFVGRLLAYYAGQLVFAVLGAFWRCFCALLSLLCTKYFGYAILFVATLFLGWCCYS
jgi:hypothetical protein